MYYDFNEEVPINEIPTALDCANSLLSKLQNDYQEYRDRDIQHDFNQLKIIYESNMDDLDIAVIYARGFKTLLPYFDVSLAQLNLIELKELASRFPFAKEIENIYATSKAYMIKERPDRHSKKVFALKELADEYFSNFEIFLMYAEIDSAMDIQAEFQKRVNIIPESLEFAVYFIEALAESISASESCGKIGNINMLEKIKWVAELFQDNEELQIVYIKSLIEMCCKFVFEIESTLIETRLGHDELVGHDLTEMLDSIKEAYAVFDRLRCDLEDD